MITRSILCGDGVERPMMFSHYSLRKMKEVSGIPAFLFMMLPDYAEDRTQTLAWAALQHWIYGTKNDMSFDTFLQGNFIPRFFSPEWFVFEKAIQQLLFDTFPEAMEMRAALASNQPAPTETTSS